MFQQKGHSTSVLTLAGWKIPAWFFLRLTGAALASSPRLPHGRDYTHHSNGKKHKGHSPVADIHLRGYAGDARTFGCGQKPLMSWRGTKALYHFNGVTTWGVAENGELKHPTT
jgi:hypothetical protein